MVTAKSKREKYIRKKNENRKEIEWKEQQINTSKK